jgi:hypothetical protein
VAVLKPRERLVYFRISEDEFRQFVSVCEQEGARSVSDLARSAVQRLIADGNRQREGEELTQKMERLENLIAALTEQLRLLTVARIHNAGVVELVIPENGRFGPNESADEPNWRKE